MNRLPASLFRILRAQRPQPLVQRRNFNLWNTVAGGASSRYLHKKILDFEPASGLYPPPESTTFELLQYHDAGKPTLSKVTVAEYLKSIARSGTMLVPREKRPDAVSPNGTEGPKAQEAMVRRYILKPVKVPTGNSILSNKKTNKFKYKPAHQYHLTVPLAKGYFEITLGRMYAALESGRTVETQVHLKRGKGKKKDEPDRAEFCQMLADNIHLRPDVILATMPELARIVVDPQTEYTLCGWVLKSLKNATVTVPNYSKSFDQIRRRAIEQHLRGNHLLLRSRLSPPGPKVADNLSSKELEW